jgi:ATP-dependent DNA helicase DinG
VLHAARRMAGGGSAYDDRVVRARLAQAFGRLIRRQGDRGVFVILSAAMPSRLLKAFPAGVPVSRVPLDEAIARAEQILPGTGRWQPQAGGGAVETPHHGPSTSFAGPPPRSGEEL